jgi:hypothetical protein
MITQMEKPNCRKNPSVSSASLIGLYVDETYGYHHVYDSSLEWLLPRRGRKILPFAFLTLLAEKKFPSQSILESS